jgi:hypothetical protein
VPAEGAVAPSPGGGGGAGWRSPSDAAYDYAARPVSVHGAVARFSLTGRIGKPLITLHGTLGALLPIGVQSDEYARLVADQGGVSLHRYYRIEGGNRVDGPYEPHRGKLRPILSCYRAAFTATTDWVEHHRESAVGRTVAGPTSDVLGNTGSLD